MGLGYPQAVLLVGLIIALIMDMVVRISGTTVRFTLTWMMVCIHHV